MKIKKGSIYLSKCLISEKCYVGQTIQNPENRIRMHLKAQSNTIFHYAIKKYKPENFVWCLLRYKDIPFWLLDDLEQFFIALYKTEYPNGYNMTPGGDFNPSKVPEIVKKRSGENHYSKTNSEAWKYNQESVLKANKDPERIAKISGKNHYANQLGYVSKISGENHPFYKDLEFRENLLNRMLNNNPMHNLEYSSKISGENHYYYTNPEGRDRHKKATTIANRCPKKIQKSKESFSKTIRKKSEESGQIWLLD